MGEINLEDTLIKHPESFKEIPILILGNKTKIKTFLL